MSEAMSMADLMKSLPAVTDPTGKSVVLTDARGNLNKISHSSLCRYSLNDTEDAGATISLRDFLEKYIQGKPVGVLMGDLQFADAKKWNIELKEGCVVSPQDYLILATKTNGSVSTGWSCLSFLMLPTRSSSKMFAVTYTTGTSPDEAHIYVKEATFAAR